MYQAKSFVPPPGFSPARITAPGGIEGLGVSASTRERGVVSNHAARLEPKCHVTLCSLDRQLRKSVGNSEGGIGNKICVLTRPVGGQKIPTRDAFKGSDHDVIADAKEAPGFRSEAQRV